MKFLYPQFMYPRFQIRKWNGKWRLRRAFHGGSSEGLGTYVSQHEAMRAACILARVGLV